MKAIKTTLKREGRSRGIRGFHLHIRVNPKGLKKKGIEVYGSKLRAFMFRLGMYIHIYRAATKKPFFHLYTNTVSKPRLILVKLGRASTIRERLLSPGGLDFEIRGGMADISFIKEVSKLFILGLEHYSDLPDTFINEKNIHSNHFGIGISKMAFGADIILNKLEFLHAAGYFKHGKVPISFLALDSVLTVEQRSKIFEADVKFSQRLVLLLGSTENEKSDTKQEKILIDDYNEIYKSWMAESDLLASYRDSLYKMTKGDMQYENTGPLNKHQVESMYKEGFSRKRNQLNLDACRLDNK